MSLLIGIAEACRTDIAGIGVNYSNACLHAGQIPVVLPRTDDAVAIAAMVSRIDVLLLAGGCDIDPVHYGQSPSPYLGTIEPARDAFEFRLLAEAVRQRRPVFGICRGIQVINVYFGGTLYQDLPTDLSPASSLHQRPDLEWEVVHPIHITPGSRLHQLLGVTEAGVNSTHHQAIRQVAPGYVVTATADDGVVEAIESTSLPIWGVQFHPERLIHQPAPCFDRLFSYDYVQKSGSLKA